MAAFLRLLPLLILGACVQPTDRCYPGEEKLTRYVDRWSLLTEGVTFRATKKPDAFMKKYPDSKTPPKIGVVELPGHPVERWVFVREGDCIVASAGMPAGSFQAFEEADK